MATCASPALVSPGNAHTGKHKGSWGHGPLPSPVSLPLGGSALLVKRVTALPLWAFPVITERDCHRDESNRQTHLHPVHGTSMRLDSSMLGSAQAAEAKKPCLAGGRLLAEPFQRPKRSWVIWFIFDRSQKVDKACEDSSERKFGLERMYSARV